MSAKGSSRWDTDDKERHRESTVERSREGARDRSRSRDRDSGKGTAADIEEVARLALLEEVELRKAREENEKIRSYAKASGICVEFLKGRCSKNANGKYTIAISY